MAGRSQNEIVVILCLFTFLWSGCRQSIRSDKEAYCLTAKEKSLLRSGDIILRKGEGWLSEIVVRHLADTLDISHCGIVIKKDSNLLVIHSLSKEVSDTDGVQCCPLDRFTAESRKGSVIVVRYRNDPHNYMASEALYYLQACKPFDRHFNLGDTSAFFCSELPLHILKYTLHVDTDITSVTPKFSYFLIPRYFDIILPPDYTVCSQVLCND